MEGARRGALEEARVRANTALSSYAKLPAAVQVSYLAALVLVLGTLMPWTTYGFEGGSDLENAQLGIETTVGAIVIATASGALVLLTRLVTTAKGRESGAIAALGLLAVAVVGAASLHVYLDDDVSVAYGLYTSVAASLALLAGGALVFGGAHRFGEAADAQPSAPGEEPLPPPD